MTRTNSTNRRQDRRRGFSLFTLAILIPILIAMLGVSADLGRVYVVKTELQAFVDAAAVAAAYELNGTSQGIQSATNMATSGPTGTNTSNKWNFDTQAVTSPTVSFAQTFNGTFVTSPASGTNYRFVQVAASAPVPLYFLPVLPMIANSKTVTADAVAGQRTITSMGDGISPFSPDAHDVADPNYGFNKGTKYTLRWSPPGLRDNPNNRCQGDVGFTPGGGSSERGYIDVGQGDGNSSLETAIVNNTFQLPSPFTIGTLLSMVQGQKHVGPAVEERFEQDTDETSNGYQTYNGNGRRLVIVPVNDNTDAAAIVGFATFFLPKNSCGHSNVTPCCGEYVGSVSLLNSKHPGAGGAGLYTVSLMR